MTKKKTTSKKPTIKLSKSKRDNRDKPKVKKLATPEMVKKTLRQGKAREKELVKVHKNAGTTRKSFKNPSALKGKIKKAPKKYKYINPHLKDLKVFNKAKLRKPDVEELKRVKKNLQNRKSKINSELARDLRKRSKKNKLTKTELNRLRKKKLDVAVAVYEINRKLGIGKELKNVPKKTQSTTKKKEKNKKGKVVEKVVTTEVVVVWEAQTKLVEMLDAKKFKEYIVNGVTIDAFMIHKVVFALTRLINKAYEEGRSTPRIIFYQRFTDKICEIEEYS